MRLTAQVGEAAPDGAGDAQATVGRGGSTQFVYYTNYEDADPANTVVYPTPPSSQCSEYWWQGRSSFNSSGNKCQEITFTTGDIINGPAHTNDTPLMSGTPEFVGLPSRQYSIETSDPACKTAKSNVNDYFGCWRDTSSQRPKFDKPPGYADTLQLPDNSSQLSTQPGCDYVGQTRIKFAGDKATDHWGYLEEMKMMTQVGMIPDPAAAPEKKK